jgi:hypothetical protein
MKKLIIKKTGAALVNFFAFSAFFKVGKNIFLGLEGVVLTFNIYFIFLQCIVLAIIFSYYKMQGSVGYLCLGLRVKTGNSNGLAFKNYLARCLPFWMFQLGMFGVQLDITFKLKGLIYACIGLLGLGFIMINCISIYFMRGRSLIDTLCKIEVYFKEKPIVDQHTKT